MPLVSQIAVSMPARKGTAVSTINIDFLSLPPANVLVLEGKVNILLAKDDRAQYLVPLAGVT